MSDARADWREAWALVSWGRGLCLARGAACNHRRRKPDGSGFAIRSPDHPGIPASEGKALGGGSQSFNNVAAALVSRASSCPKGPTHSPGCAISWK